MKKLIINGNLYGKILLFIGILVGFPILIIPFYPSDTKYISSFLIPSCFSIILGFISCHYFPNKPLSNGYREGIKIGSLAVLFAWLYGVIAGAIPFILADLLNPIQALFEAVSGWTTTGLSVIDVASCPHIFLFHRGFMQFCGGLGFIMMMIVFIHGKNSMPLYNAEGHPDKLFPNIRKTAQIICIIYCGFLIIGTLMYLVCGMNLFDSIIHTMCSLSTGGFSTKVESIGYYNSPAIEVVTIVQMLVGTTNFAALLLLTKGKFVEFFRISEIKFLSILLIIFIPITTFILTYNLYINLGEGFRLAVFNIISAISTTGYSTMPYNQWPQPALAIMIIMMLIGGGIGSTAGGLKLTRVYILLRSTLQHIKRKLSTPRKIDKLTYTTAHGKEHINDSLIYDVSSYFICYLILFIIGSIAISIAANCDLISAMFDFSSSLGTVGLSIGITGPTTNMTTLIIEMLGMLLGRLEILVFFIGIYEIYTSILSRVRNR